MILETAREKFPVDARLHWIKFYIGIVTITSATHQSDDRKCVHFKSLIFTRLSRDVFWISTAAEWLDATRVNIEQTDFDVFNKVKIAAFKYITRKWQDWSFISFNTHFLVNEDIWILVRKTVKLNRHFWLLID